MNEVMKVEYKGKLCTVAELSAMSGLTPNNIRSRLKRNHPIEEVLCPTLKKKATKSDAELYLNDLPTEHLPKVVKDCMKVKVCKAKRVGDWFRNEFRPLFDKWYEEDFLPSR